jgi:hypothetical protein
MDRFSGIRRVRFFAIYPAICFTLGKLAKICLHFYHEIPRSKEICLSLLWGARLLAVLLATQLLNNHAPLPALKTGHGNVPIKVGVGGFGVEVAGLDLRDFAPGSHRGRGNVLPGGSVVTSDVNEASSVPAQPEQDGGDSTRFGIDTSHHRQRSTTKLEAGSYAKHSPTPLRSGAIP